MVFGFVRARFGRRFAFRRQLAGGTARLCRRRDRFSTRAVEPCGNGIRPVPKQLPGFNQPGGGGVVSGRGALQAGTVHQCHHVAVHEPRPRPARWRTSIITGWARRNFKAGISPTRRRCLSRWRAITPNRPCGCGRRWRRRRLMRGFPTGGGTTRCLKTRTASSSSRRERTPQTNWW